MLKFILSYKVVRRKVSEMKYCIPRIKRLGRSWNREMDSSFYPPNKGPPLDIRSVISSMLLSIVFMLWPFQLIKSSFWGLLPIFSWMKLVSHWYFGKRWKKWQKILFPCHFLYPKWTQVDSKKGGGRLLGGGRLIRRIRYYF